MKPVIPDYDWSIFGVRVIMKTLLTSGCINQRGAGHLHTLTEHYELTQFSHGVS